MRFPLLIFALALAFATLSTDAWAGAADKHSSVRVTTCDIDAHTASFKAKMTPFKGAVGLSLRFTLQTRDTAAPVWRRVAAPGYGTFLTATAGSPAYIVDRILEDLPVGAEYRVVVRFRWRDAAGAVVAKTLARSRACALPDKRANLVPELLTAEPGATPTMSVYTLRVVNTGQSEASEFFVRLTTSDGQVAEASTDGPLGPAGVVELRLEAPACMAGSQLTATVDTEAEIDESDETDNVLSVACPEASKRPAAPPQGS